MNKRVAFFDCARSLCLLHIVGYWHIYRQFTVPAKLPAALGNSLTQGVLATFFFISAYFLGRKPIASPKDALRFYQKRLLRFYPLFFLSATSLLAIHYLFRVDYISSFRQYVLSLFGLSCFFTPAPQTIWFVSMLIPFYLVTPMINALKSIWQKVICCAALLLAICAMKILGMPLDVRLVQYFPVYSAGLILGSCIDIPERPQPFLLAGGFLLFCAGVALVDHANLFVCRYPPMIGCIPVMIEVGKLLTRPAVTSRIFRFISYGSMVAYLFHRQYFGIPLMIIGKLPVWFFYLIVLPVFLVISWLVQYAYDRIVDRIAAARQ